MTALPLERTLTDVHGIDITFFEWPTANPKAVVQLVHGLGEHARRYEHVASALNRAGYSVYATDHRGHGHTGVSMRQSGAIKKQGQLGDGGMKAVFTDELELTSVIEGENPGAGIVLLGHSWGSMIAQRLLDTDAHRYAAVVLSGSTLLVPGLVPNGGNDKKFVANGLQPLGHEWLSRDPEVSRAFREDPLNFPESGLKIWGFLETLKLMGLPKRGLPAELPFLLLAGSEDALGAEKGNQRLLRALLRAGVQDVELIIYHEARHEVFNEINREEVLSDLVSWLDGEFLY